MRPELLDDSQTLNARPKPRDWIMHPELLDELRGKSDTDMYCLQRVPFVDGRKWKGHVVHNSILVEHKSQ